MEPSKSKLFKQRLFSVHINVGIIVSILLYISLFFGVFTIFLPYIKVWEKPSRHIEIIHNQEINYSKIVDSVISNPDYPKNDISIEFPGFKNDPTIRIKHKFVETNYFNPHNEEKIEVEKRDASYLADFLNELHYGKPLLIIGKLIFGFMAVAVMFLIIGGLFLIYYFKFNNNGKNQQSTFSMWHRKILTFTFLPLLLICIAGGFMNISYKSAAPMTYLLSKGENSNFFKFTNSVLLPKEQKVKLEKEKTKMLSLNALIAKAKQINPEIRFHELKLINWNDKSARIEIKGYNPYKPFLNGVYNKPKLIINAVNGSIIKDVRVLDRAWSVLLIDSFYFLHLLYDVEIFTRLFVALLMVLSCLAIGFGVMLWLEKKAKVFDEKIVFYHWLGKLSLSAMIGIIPASAMLFVMQWLLPFDLENRVLIQQVVFYNSWLVTLTWSFYRLNSYTAAKEFLFVGGVLFIFSSILHFVISDFSPIELYNKNMFSILAVDIVLILFGSVLLIISKKLPKTRTQAKFFWNKKYKRQTNE